MHAFAARSMILAERPSRDAGAFNALSVKDAETSCVCSPITVNIFDQAFCDKSAASLAGVSQRRHGSRRHGPGAQYSRGYAE